MRRFFQVASSFAVFFAAGLAFADPIPSPDAPSIGPAAVTPPSAAPADSTTVAMSPRAADEERTAKNVLYIEGGGPALLYSLNYERTFGDFSGRIGLMYFSVSASGESSDGSSGGSASAAFLGVPLEVNYLGIGSKKNMLELGIGATIFHAGEGASAFGAGSKTSASAGATWVWPNAIVGYRYQPPDGGFVFRAGLAPMVAPGLIAFIPLPYLALGGAFGP